MTRLTYEWGAYALEDDQVDKAMLHLKNAPDKVDLAQMLGLIDPPPRAEIVMVCEKCGEKKEMNTRPNGRRQWRCRPCERLRRKERK